MISLDTTTKDTKTILAIVKRVTEKIVGIDSLSLTMDISAVHVNGCPLRLKDLLKADDFNFWHDIFGIQKHINRATGQLNNCFIPRFATIREITNL